MSGIKTTTGLISGIDIGSLVDSLINVERAPARRLETRLANVKATQAGLTQLQAQLLSLSTSAQNLANRRTFSQLGVQASDASQMSVVSKSTSIAGNYAFQTVAIASAHRSLSRGFADTTQTFGQAGQLVITRENQLSQPVRLELLNGGQGVQRGTIRLTDRSGKTADVDLTGALTVDDVVASINTAGLGVEARTEGDRLVLVDTTGQTASNLTVADLGSGQTAANLGIRQSVAASSLTGSDVFEVTSDFTLSLINDGNALRTFSSGSELSIGLADGTTLAIDFDNAKTVGDLVSKINSATGNSGKLTAALQNGRLTLTDTTSGAGTLTVSNQNGSNAKEVFGLTTAASGGTITGEPLSGGLNSVLLRHLRGGQGIQTPGSLSLTDRAGNTATVDLSTAKTLDDVLSAINNATSASSVKLKLSATLNANGTGLSIRDTSGSTSGNLIIADVGGGTVATDLGIATNSAQSEVTTSSLARRTVNEATLLSSYSPRGVGVSTGSFRITDSSGAQAVININTNVRTVGDVIDRINDATGIQVTAKLNETGDGFVIVDDAGGADSLTIAEVGGRTAADLRLLGTAVTGSSGKPEISSRKALVVDVSATDSITTLNSKINLVGGTVKGSVVNTGSLLNGTRLSLTSTQTGDAGRFVVEESGVNLGFAVQDEGHDAVLRIGSNPATSYLKTSATNVFTDAPGNFDITVKAVGTTINNVTAQLDTASITKAVQDFVTAYNAYVDTSTSLTRYDPATQTRAALQGTSAPLLVQSRLTSLIVANVGSSTSTYRNLASIGVVPGSTGKLTLDSTALQTALTNAPDEVLTLFADTTEGFGKRLNDAITGFTDKFDGTLTAQGDALQRNIDELTSRIAGIDDRLVSRRQRLELQFTQMETALSGLQSQSSSLSNLSNVLANLKAK